MRVTFTYDGVQYKDYEFLTPNLDYLTSATCNYILGALEHDTIHDDKLLASTLPQVTPARGSSLFVAQPCPLCNADIRKNYVIKRNPDAADYCVISSIDKVSVRVASYATAIVPRHKQIFTFLSRQYSATHSIDAHVHFSMPYIDDKDVIYIREIIYFYQEQLSDFHIDYISNKLTKPVVFYKSLDMETGNKLDTDLLYLVYKTASASGSNDDYEKMVLQLESLNQHNWRDYPGTMCLLFRILLYNRGTYNYYAYSPSKLPKAIKQFACRNVPDVDFKNISHDDFEMSRAFLSQLLGLNGTMYATLDSTMTKIREFGIRADILDTFFNVTVRIVPKTTNS